jgi:RNA polymerase sigma-70 factor (ECF subfamily)
MNVGWQLAVEIGVHGSAQPVMSEQIRHRPGNPPAPRPIPKRSQAEDSTECDRSGPGYLDVEPRAASNADYCQAAFARYVLPEVELLLRVARSLTPRPADAEDLVQDTLIRAFQGIGGFDGAHPRAWLLTIMRNTEINRHRRRRPELLDDQDATFARLATSDGQVEHTPEGLVVGEAFETVVSDALAALPDRYRQTVTLVDLHGLSYAEASEALGIPVGTVMSRLHRARARMRQRLIAAGLAPRRRL